ncbi:MAG TPA: hypothetical protein VIK07_11760, partial [Bacteroidales bacterium]
GSFATSIGTDKVTSAMILDGTIVNIDVASGAAIAGTKIAPDFGTQNVVTTGTITGSNLSGTNTGDQTSIVGITGTLTEFNTALIGADFATGGGTATGANTSDVTLGTANGLSLSTQQLSLALSTGATSGAMSATDKTKLDAITGSNTGDQTITLTGDVTGSGTGSFATSIGTDKVTSAMILDGTIVNIDVASGAAISGTKINPDFGNQTVTIGTGAGATAGMIVLNDATVGTSNTATIKAPTSVTTTYALTLPVDAGLVNQVLRTDGTGNLSWSNTTSGTVTDVTGTAPISSTGGSTPAISITAATTGAAGSMSAADKTKLDAITGTNTGDETTTTIKTKLGAATTAVDGYLTAADWTTFNGKQGSLGYTAENSANKVISISGTSTDTEYPSAKLTYDQLIQKAATNQSFFLGATSIPINRPTGSIALTGITSIDGNAATATTATNIEGGAAGAVPYQSGIGTTYMTAVGTLGQVLTSNGAAAPTWENLSSSAGFSGNTINNTIGAGLTRYTTINGTITPTGTYASAGTSTIIWRNGIIKNLRVRVSGNPGSVNNTLTLMVNGAATALSATLSGVTTGNDLADSIIVNAGDEVSIRIVTGAGNAVLWSWALEFSY